LIEQPFGYSKIYNKYVARNWQNNAPDFEIYNNFKDLLKNRAVALGNIIFAPNKQLWEKFVEENMYITREKCSVCITKKKKRKASHLISHCPKCGKRVHTNGSVRGVPRFTCNNPEEHKKPCSFTLNTCMEHQLFLYFCALQTLEYLGQGMPLKGIKKITGMTRHFIELVISGASEELKSIEPDKISEDFVVVYIDGVYAVKGCILVAKIGNRIVWKCCEGEYWEPIKSLLLKLNKIIDAETIIFVTDGLSKYVDPIREVFPNAIHVRHFHNTFEDILIHFQYEYEIYSLYLKYDFFLEKGDKTVTLWKGVKYFLDNKKEKKKKQKKNVTERLEEIVELINKNKRWDGRLMQRFSGAANRVADMIIQNKVVNDIFQNILDKIQLDILSLRFRHRLKDRIKEIKMRINRKEIKYKAKTRKKRVEKICKGELNVVAKEHPQIDYAIDIIKKEFDGKHITTNPVEGVHSHFLPLIRTHRTEKGTHRLINLVLHLRYSLHSLEKILSFEKFRCAVVKRNKQVKIEEGKEFLIKYRDRLNHVTHRKIKILSFNKRRIDAHCYLKDNFRTFRRDRIILAEPISVR
jgi:hypothetical protein